MKSSATPRVTVAIPSFNQGIYLEQAICSVLSQNVSTEIILNDGGSTDSSIDVIRKYAKDLKGWSSGPDGGQAAAINAGIAQGTSEYVAWVNSDDWLEPNGLETLIAALDRNKDAPFAYGKAWNFNQKRGTQAPIWVEPFSRNRLAIRCIVCQPATLIRRSCWEACGGLNPSMNMAMDYDLWWRLYKTFGEPEYVDKFIAVNRDHELTKTRTKRRLHYREAMQVVKRHNSGNVPLKWWLAQPYAVWYKSLVG